ncbi:MAG: Fic family protein [Saprospiraceae bacterium]
MDEHTFDQLQILRPKFLSGYKEGLVIDLSKAFSDLPFTHQLSTETFSFYTSVAAAYSSMIEGEKIEVDSYLKSQMKPGVFKKNYTKKTDDLLVAYQFAEQAKLNFENLLKAHSLLSANFLRKVARGRIRTGMEFILDKDDKIVYVAAHPNIVRAETNKLFADIDLLLEIDLTIQESFYFAAMIQLVFLKIHPFEDGNGRAARLLEKWFLSEKLGQKAWNIQSEKYYYNNLQAYYKNLHIGIDYENLDYNKCLSLLYMLSESLNN